jgi:hypothetical protein
VLETLLLGLMIAAGMERQPLSAARNASRTPFDATWMFTECAPER